MTITEFLTKQVNKMAAKDDAVKGLCFKNKKELGYKFDNGKEYKMLVEPEVPAPFLHIPAKAPGILTEHKVALWIDKIMQEEPEQANKEQAMWQRPRFQATYRRQRKKERSLM